MVPQSDASEVLCAVPLKAWLVTSIEMTWRRRVESSEEVKVLHGRKSLHSVNWESLGHYSKNLVLTCFL